MKYENFVVYIAALTVDLGDKIHPLKKTQIAYLKADEASTKVFSKYIDFVDVFFFKTICKTLWAYKDQQLCYRVSR